MLNDYRVFPNAVPKDICNAILAAVDWSDAGTGLVSTNNTVTEGKEDAESRITEVTWVHNMSVVGCIAQTYLININALAGWNFTLGGMENVQVGKYEEGGHYDWHIDAGNPDQNGQMRKLTLSLLLNDPSEFEGGKLEIGQVSEQPVQEQGTIVIFPSYVLHRVTPVTSGVRYSAVTWFNGPAFR